MDPKWIDANGCNSILQIDAYWQFFLCEMSASFRCISCTPPEHLNALLHAAVTSCETVRRHSLDSSPPLF